MGLRDRRTQNEVKRARGTEPMPGDFAGVKRWARYLARVFRPVHIENPAKFLNASARRAA